MMIPLAQLQVIPQGEDYVRILPVLVLSVFGILIMILDPLVDEEKSQKTLGLIAFVGTLAALALDLVHVALSGTGVLGYGKGRQLQHVLQFSGHRHCGSCDSQLF